MKIVREWHEGRIFKKRKKEKHFMCRHLYGWSSALAWKLVRDVLFQCSFNYSETSFPGQWMYKREKHSHILFHPANVMWRCTYVFYIATNGFFSSSFNTLSWCVCLFCCTHHIQNYSSIFVEYPLHWSSLFHSLCE